MILKTKNSFLANCMVSRKSPDLAKQQAVNTTFGLIFLAFVVALAIAFVVPRLLSSVLNSSTTEPTKTIVTVLTSLTTTVFLMWFSSERVKNTVGLAIEAAVNQKTKEYEKQNPAIEERLRIQLQEYTCAIPVTHRSESSIRYSSPSPSICDRRIGRDAVIRSLSYNDELLQAIALAGVDETLETLCREDVDRETRSTFLTDIYAYLKGWLMSSITHSHPMPVSYIQQRYPNPRHPDFKAYITALEIIRGKSLKSSTVHAAMNEILKNRHAVAQAVNLLDEYLEILILELTKANS